MLEHQGEIYRERIADLEGILRRIRARGGTIWDGYECATYAVAVLDGPNAGRAHAEARQEDAR